MTIPTADRGKVLYYQVRAINGSGGTSPFSSPITVSTPTPVNESIALPSRGRLEDYVIISIPEGTGASTNLTAESFVNEWRVMHYKNDATGNEDVRDLTKMAAGLGYWMNTNINPAPTITIAGTASPGNKTLTLQPGWNQIGDPFNFSISWADALAKNSSVTGVGKLYTYGSGAFKEEDGLRAFGGGFVNNTNTSNAVLTIPVNVARFTGRKAGGKYDIEGRDLSENEWFLPLEIQSGGKTNDLGGIGMHPNAKGSIDLYDAVALPRFFNFVDLSTDHPEFFQPRFMRDVVNSSNEHTWTFTATAGGVGDDAALRWDNASWRDGQATLYLLDEAEGIVLDMRKYNEYLFGLPAPRKIKLFYSKDGGFSPGASAMGQPYPNPSSDQITFPFLAVDGESISIQLFDMTGKPIHQLGVERATPGYHEVSWDGTDSQGRVATGIYLYRFVSTGGATRLGKIILR